MSLGVFQVSCNYFLKAGTSPTIQPLPKEEM